MKYDRMNKEGKMAQFRDHESIIKRAKAIGKKLDMSFSQICRRGLRMALKSLEEGEK